VAERDASKTPVILRSPLTNTLDWCVDRQEQFAGVLKTSGERMLERAPKSLTATYQVCRHARSSCAYGRAPSRYIATMASEKLFWKVNLRWIRTLHCASIVSDTKATIFFTIPKRSHLHFVDVARAVVNSDSPILDSDSQPPNFLSIDHMHCKAGG
jgi:hypothetical protein